MSFPRQDSVAARLQAEANTAIGRLRAGHKEDLAVEWRRYRRSLQADISTAYRWAAPQGRWDLSGLQTSGAWHALQMRLGATLRQFHARSSSVMRRAFADVRAQSALRHAWVLDQISPHSTRPQRRKSGASRESDVPAEAWQTRWAEWTRAYDQALLSNLRLNALNNGNLEDAVAEVDATRANTPAFTLEAAMNRLFDWEADTAFIGGMHQSLEENEGVAEKEIWRTRGDLRVCDDCDANEGLEMEEADGEIPLHPNCNCFYQIVPASFAQLLRSGDEGDRELARQMDYEGMTPNMMAMRDGEGNVVGKVIVDFKEWLGAQGAAVAGRI